MDPRAIFGIDVLLSFLSSMVVAALFVWPQLRAIKVESALLWLVMPHMFLRFIGLSFLVPGVVSEELPRAWAAPAAYGDFAAGILAIISTVALVCGARWAVPAVWVFNIWGTADLLFAFYEGWRVQLDPGSLGAGFYIVTTLVPPLLVSHA